MKSTNYDVIFAPFTERHYIKTFEKKYKSAWDVTSRIITEEFKQIDFLFLKSVAETICDFENIKICKTEFRIFGTKESRHGSGNRCIVAIHKDTNLVRVLLVYNKTNLSGHNETAEWKKLVKENYIEYATFL